MHHPLHDGVLQEHWAPYADAMAVVDFVRLFGSLLELPAISVQVRRPVLDDRCSLSLSLCAAMHIACVPCSLATSSVSH